MSGMPQFVPYGADQTLYLVMDTIGPKDLALQTPIERPDFDTVVSDLLSARFNNPVGIYAFNTLEHWTADITKNVAEEIQCRCDIDGAPVPTYLQDFVASSLSPARTGRR